MRTTIAYFPLLICLLTPPAQASTLPPMLLGDGRTSMSLGVAPVSAAVLYGSTDVFVSERLSIGVAGFQNLESRHGSTLDGTGNRWGALRATYAFFKQANAALGVTLSGGISNVIRGPFSSNAPMLPDNYVFFQPAINFSVSEQFGRHESGFGMVTFRLTAGFVFNGPNEFESWRNPIDPAINTELAFRLDRHHEAVLGGSNYSTLGLPSFGWRSSF
jgi:hypothetical protein